MKYAVISDIHANFEALTVCLEKINKINPDRIICLGDLVDYCAQPNECVEVIKRLRRSLSEMTMNEFNDLLAEGNHLKGFSS